MGPDSYGGWGGEGQGLLVPSFPFPFSAQRWPRPHPSPRASVRAHRAAAVTSISRISVSVARHHKGFVLPYGFLKVPRGFLLSGTWWTEPPPPGVSHVAHSKMTYTPSTDISRPQKVTQPQLMSKEVQSYHMT